MSLLIEEANPGKYDLLSTSSSILGDPFSAIDVDNSSSTTTSSLTQNPSLPRLRTTDRFSNILGPSKSSSTPPINSSSFTFVAPITRAGQKRGVPSPVSNPVTSRPRLNNYNLSDVLVSDDNDGIISEQLKIIQKQSSEIESLRKDFRTLTDQMSFLTSLIKQLVPSFTQSQSNPNPLPNVSSSVNNSSSVLLTNLNQTSTLQPTKAPVTRKSYAEIASARGLDGEKHESAVKALQHLCKRPVIRPTLSTLKKVYVQGIVRQPIKDLKQALQAVRIRTSALPSISFVGLQTVEFLVTSDYVSGFKKAINDLCPVDGRFKILDCFDASSASDPNASRVLKKRLQESFVNRVHGILRKNTNKSATDFFTHWLKSLNLPLPEIVVETAEDAMEEEDHTSEETLQPNEEVTTPPLLPTTNAQLAPIISL